MDGMQLHLTLPEHNTNVNKKRNSSQEFINDIGWADVTVPPIASINNYTITFNFPWEIITVSFRHVSINVFPFWLLYPTSSLHLISSLSSVFRLAAAAQHHSRFILLFNYSIFLSHSLVLVLMCSVSLRLSTTRSLPSSCAMAGSCNAIYPTYCVAMAPLKPVALWVNIVPHDWKNHQ